MKTIVLLTGPLGVNVGYFNRLLTQSGEVCDLTKLENKNKFWEDPAKNIPKFDWEDHKYYVMSVVCPMQDDTLPSYFKFLNEFQKMDFNIRVAIVGDKLKKIIPRQKRMLQRNAMLEFYVMIEKLNDFGPLYVSRELEELYTSEYSRFLQNYLKIPVLIPEKLDK